MKEDEQEKIHTIKHVKNLLICCLWRDNDTITILKSLDISSTATVLFSDKRRNISFDTTSTKTDNNNSDNITRESCAGFNGTRNRSTCKDDESYKVNDTEKQDRLVFAQVLISNNRTKNLENQMYIYILVKKIRFLYNV